MTRRVLFLCTGNYYRSRFAEELFNLLARRAGLDWRADSCGLALDRGTMNVGAISPFTAVALAARGMNPPSRLPRAATACDFESADRVIALKEAEHRPLMAARFPAWADRIEYWHVHDLDAASADVALSEIETLVEALVSGLQQK